MDATTRAIQGRKDRRMSDTISRQANDLADTLGDSAEMLAHKVVVRNNRDCVINVYMKK